jgi:nucleoside-diphosphate-sugar epimerase
VSRVRSVARRPLPPHPKLVHTCADLRDPVARQALAGVDVLWHLGFALWRGASSSEVNRSGLDHVLAARPGRLVLASSAAVYGAWPDNPLPLPEDSPARPNPECRYAVDKWGNERRVLDSGVPAIVLRIGAVLGSHADRRIQRAARGYRLAVPAVRGVQQALQFLDEDEVAAAILEAGRCPMVGVVNVAPADWLSAVDVARLTGGRVVPMPRSLLLGLSEAAYRLRLLPFGSDRSVLVNGPLALDHRRALAWLGWQASLSSAGVLRASVSGPRRQAR